MKKIISILLVLIAFISNAQDPNPLPSIAVKKLIAPNTPTLYYDQADSLVKMYKGAYEWTWLIGKSYSDRYLVPYDGANRDVHLNTHSIATSGVKFNTVNPLIVSNPGEIGWDAADGTLDLRLLNNTTLQMGQESYFYGKAIEPIANGDPVMIAGVQGNHLTFKKAIYSELANYPQKFLGIATQNIATNDFGYVTWFGKVHDTFTTGWSAGDNLYFDPITNLVTNVLPSAPYVVIRIGSVIELATGAAENGTIGVRPTFGIRLQDLNDVNGTTLTTKGQFPVWDQANQYFDFDYNIWPDLISNEAYSGSWNGIDSIAASKNAVYDKISTLESINYCAATMTVTTGTLNQGTVSDLCAVGGTDVIVQERVANPPFQIDFTFTGVIRLSGIKFYGRYNGGATHNVHVECYNYVSATWDYVGEFSSTTNKQWFAYNLNLPNNYLSGGNVQVRIIHQDTGINTHQMILDYINVNYGGGGGSGFITAGAVEFTPNGNISATNVQAAIQELDTEKEPLLTKGSLTESITGLQFSATQQVIGGATDLSLSSGYVIPTTTEQTNWTTAYTNRITSLTTTGSSGASTLISNTLNIPNYTLSGLGGQPQLNGTGFVKASGTTISYDNSTYEPAFAKNTAFNKNFGTTVGTVLEGRTFGTAANSATTDFSPASGSGNYIQNGTTQQSTSNFNISGSGTAGTGFNIPTGQTYKVNGTQISSANLSNDTNLAKLDATNHAFTGTGFHSFAGYLDAAYLQVGSNTTTAGSMSYNATKGLQLIGKVGTVYDFAINTPSAATVLSIPTGTNNVNIIGTIQATTAKLTNLIDGYLPYHISDASGLGNSPIYTDGANVGIGTTGITDAQITLGAGGENTQNIGNSRGAAFNSYYYSPDSYNQYLDIGVAGADVKSVMRFLTQSSPNTSPSERMRINSNGNIGIGTVTTPAQITLGAGQDVSQAFGTDRGATFNTYYFPADSYNQYLDIGVSGSNEKSVIRFLNNTVSSAVPSEQMRISSIGNVGIGYSTGTEITNNKLAVNGRGYFNGTINSTGYLLNNNNLFSSLSSGYLPYWDGGKFVNSEITRDYLTQNYAINGVVDGAFKLLVGGRVKNIGSEGGFTNWIENTLTDGNGSGLVVTAANNSGGINLYLRKQDGSEILKAMGTGKIIINDLASTNARLLSSSSTGQLTAVSNAAGYLFNDGSGNFSNSYPEVTSLLSTGGINGYVATANGNGGIDLRPAQTNVTSFIKQKSSNGIFALAHSSVVYNNALYIGERKQDPKVVKFSNLDDLSVYTSATISGTGRTSAGLEQGYYVSSIGKIVFCSRATGTGTDLIEVDPTTLAYTIHNFSAISGSSLSSGTDGTYIYIANATLFKKIRVSDWTEVASVSVPAELVLAHSLQVNVARGKFYVTGSQVDPVYLAIVNTSDLSYTTVNLGAYVKNATDDMFFYDNGTDFSKLFVCGEFNITGLPYGGVVVDFLNSNALSQLKLNPSYGLFRDGVKAYSCGIDGNIQTFSVLDHDNISQFPMAGFTPNEILTSSDGRSYFTNWDAANSLMAEFYVPVPQPLVTALTNPMTTTGDMIYSSGSTPTRLPIGSTNQVLTTIGGVPSWQNPTAGFTDPMTTRGDIIHRNASNVTARLGVGSNGQLLGSNGTDVLWVNAPTGTTQWTTDGSGYGISYGPNVGIGKVSAQNIKIDALSTTIGNPVAQFKNSSSTGSGVWVYGGNTVSDASFYVGSYNAGSGGRDIISARGDGQVWLPSIPTTTPLANVVYFDTTNGSLKYGAAPSGTGGVTSVTSNSLSPLFTTTVSNQTTTPSFSFVANPVAQKLVYMGAISGSGVPTFRNFVVGDISATGTPSASTYLRGDGSWSTPPGTSLWQQLTGAIAPLTITDEVRIGSTSDLGSGKLQVSGRSNFTDATGTSAYGIELNSNSTVGAMQINSSASYGLIINSSAEYEAGYFTRSSSSTNTSLPINRIQRITTGTPAIGIGAHESFYTSTSSGGGVIAEYGRFGLTSTSITSSSESGKFVWSLKKNGTMRVSMELDETGTSTIGAVLKLAPADTAPSTPTLGMIYVNTDTHIYFYNGTSWVRMDN